MYISYHLKLKLNSCDLFSQISSISLSVLSPPPSQVSIRELGHHLYLPLYMMVLAHVEKICHPPTTSLLVLTIKIENVLMSLFMYLVALGLSNLAI